MRHRAPCWWPWVRLGAPSWLCGLFPALLGCSSAPSSATNPLHPAPGAHPSTSSQVEANGPRAAPAPACELRLEAPSAERARPGPVYLRAGIHHPNIARIDTTGGTPIAPSARRDQFTRLTAGPRGELWISDWDGVWVLDPGSDQPRLVTPATAGILLERLNVRLDRDLWAATSAIEWEVVHYDGQQWTSVGKRRQFRGKYDDNKLVAIAPTSEGIWISSWNGLWQRSGKDWQRIEPPPGEQRFANLFPWRDQLIAVYDPAAIYLREGSSWRKLRDWPESTRVWAVDESGLIVGEGTDPHTIVLSTLDGDCIVTSQAPRGGRVSSVAVDGRARVWLATEFGLVVLDRRGRVVGEWTAGTLDGYAGMASELAVAGAGPEPLPPPKPSRRLEIVGRLEIYKNGAPLVGATVELCPGLNREARCSGAPFVRRMVTGADGAFRLPDVPEGEYSVHVWPPQDESGCQSPFTVVGFTLETTRECPPGSTGPCDLGIKRQCFPFEMPPRHR